MPEQLTLDEILRLNPHLDAVELSKLLQQLREAHAVPRRPSASPTDRRLVVDEDAGRDPRTVKLRYRR